MPVPSSPRLSLRTGVLAATVVALITSITATAPADAAPKKSSTSFDSTSYVAGAGALAVHGEVPGRKRKVMLQVKTKGGWATIKSTRSAKDGSYAISAPFTWYGTHKIRVTAAGRPSYTKSTKAAISPGYTPLGDPKDWDLLKKNVNSNWRFDPCSTVRYQVNADDTGPVGITLAQQAMAQISAATGIKVKYTGTTHIIPSAPKSRNKRFRKNTNLVIAWGDNTEVPAFTQVGADGLGGPRLGRAARNTKGKRVTMTTQAGVTLQTENFRDYYAPSFESTTGNPGTGHLLLHEIGHAFGLDHSTGADEMMFGGLWTPDADGVYRSRLAAGDLTGLDKVGLQQGCLRPVRNGRIATLNAAEAVR